MSVRSYTQFSQRNQNVLSLLGALYTCRVGKEQSIFSKFHFRSIKVIPLFRYSVFRVLQCPSQQLSLYDNLPFIFECFPAQEDSQHREKALQKGQGSKIRLSMA